MLTHQAPIESQFTRNLEDNLNAEIVLGAAAWAAPCHYPICLSPPRLSVVLCMQSARIQRPL